MNRSIRYVVAASCLFYAGCGAVSDDIAYLETKAPQAETTVTDASESVLGGRAGDDAGGEVLADDGQVSADERKIIYTATIDLVVDDFPAADASITRLVRQMDGYIAEFREDRTFGERLAGHWTVRIPVARFDTFLDEVVALGVPESRQVNAQDVTEEFVDLEARLSNKRRLEERILKLLDELTGKIKDVIEVETELGRVREEIERMEGRLRFLKNRTSLTTVTINAREERNYKPPQAPGFSTRIGTAWTDSLLGLKTAGENLAVAAVASVPWMIALLVIFFPLYYWLRAWRRRRRQQ